MAIGELWEAAAVTFLFTFGAALETPTLSRTRGALRELLTLAPVSATVLRGGRQVEVAGEWRLVDGDLRQARPSLRALGQRLGRSPAQLRELLEQRNDTTRTPATRLAAR